MKALAKILAVSILTLPVLANAQIAPPAPGVAMPQGYYDRLAQDPSAFQFQKAWIQKSARARQAREELMREQPGPEALTMASLPDAVRQKVAVSGTIRVPVIAIDYSNRPAPFTAAAVENQLFNGPTTSAGTLTDLYSEMSFGMLNLTGDVLGWVHGTGTDAYYEGGCNGLCGSAKTGTLILQALQGVDGTTDFGVYDNDGPDGLPNSGDDDGFVDFIAIVQPETGGECGNSNMWSHRWVVTGWPEFAAPYQTNDVAAGGGVIQILDYTIQPVLGSVNGCGTGMNEIGVFGHEFGHAFGLPDLYDTNGGGQGIGEQGLMGSGNWQTPPDPVHMSAWSKQQLGWVNPQIVVGPKQNYNIDYVSANDDVYQLNVVEEKFNRKNFNPIAGSYSLHCGLPTVPANNRNWGGAAGYGNGWDEAIRHDFTYSGSGSVTLEYDVAYDTEATYDFGLVKIDVGGTVDQLASYDGNGAANNVSIDLTPYLSGPTSYQIIFEFTSDIAWSDEDGQFDSGSNGPFKIDNVSVTGGGENYSTGFETNEAGWYCDFAKNPYREYFLVENRNKAGLFDGQLNGEGLHIWHIENNVAFSSYGNTSGSQTTSNLKPAGVQFVCADGLNQLLLGANRGDAGDPFPGTTGNTTWNNTTTPDSKSHNGFATNVCVENISAPGTTMTADLLGGFFPPTVGSISPATGEEDAVVGISSIDGTFFLHGATALLRRNGYPDAPLTNVVWYGKNKLSADLDLTGVTPGEYDVVVQNPDGQEAVLAAGFNVTQKTPVFIQAFEASARDDGVELAWDLYADEAFSGFRIMRRARGGEVDVEVNGNALIPADRRSYLDETVDAGASYDYVLVVVLENGGELLSQRISARARGYQLGLQQNFPNPFNPTTTIRFTLPERGNVSLTVFSPTGERVRRLIAETRDAGVNTAVWDGRNDAGDQVSSGVYLYKLSAGNRVLTRKMVLLK